MPGGLEGDVTVRLKALPEERFAAFREHNIHHYAQDKVDAGVWSFEEAPRRAAADVDSLLTEGTRTGNHFLCTVHDARGGEEVGSVWFAIRETGAGRVVWVYDVEIFDQFRRRGFATSTLDAVQQRARELGAGRVELHVFGHNAAARRLYERLGFVPTSIVMSRRLDEPEPRGSDL